MEVSRRALGEECLRRFVSSSENTVGKRELDFVVVELHSVGTNAVLGRKLLNVNDLDGRQTSTMATSHILVQLGDSTRPASVAVLLVHVVGSRARIVAQPDTVIANAI